MDTAGPFIAAATAADFLAGDAPNQSHAHAGRRNVVTQGAHRPLLGRGAARGSGGEKIGVLIVVYSKPLLKISGDGTGDANSYAPVSQCGPAIRPAPR